MKPHNTLSRKRQEAGVALLISIFILLLVSGVALALVANSGSESSLAGNFRSSATAYDAGSAGLEEARGRLLPGSANYFNTTVPGFIPVGAPLAIGQVRYILNPVNAADVVAPATAGSTYADTEYQQEWGTPVTGAVVQTINSVWANSAVAGMPGPMYKWVRITPATEQSLNIDVNSDGIKNAVTPLYYDPAHIDAGGTPRASLIVSALPPSTARQVFEVTSLAVLPNGSKKIEQYVVTPITYNLNFPSALTLPASNVTFTGAHSNPYNVNGQDGSGTPSVAVPGCVANPATSLPAIGTTDAPGLTTNKQAIVSGIPRPGNYTGGGLATPSVADVTPNAALDTPAALDQLVQTISQNADAVLGTPPPPGSTNPLPSYTASNLPSSMLVSGSSCTSDTVVVNGNFDLGPNTGCGLLVVTGNFTYAGNSGWNGVILVIGNGTATFQGNGGGNGQFDGAIFVAATEDSTYHQLPALGPVNFDISGGGGNGIYYNSCWVNKVNQAQTLKALAFHEIAQ
jgi:hypothetical protein